MGMEMDEEFLAILRGTFTEEAREHIEASARVLLALERGASGPGRDEALKTVFREAHSLKGAARVVDAAAIEAVAHGMEDVLDGACTGAVRLTPALIDLLVRCLDLLSLDLERFQTGSPAPAMPEALRTALAEAAAGTGETGAIARAAAAIAALLGAERDGPQASKTPGGGGAAPPGGESSDIPDNSGTIAGLRVSEIPDPPEGPDQGPDARGSGNSRQDSRGIGHLPGRRDGHSDAREPRGVQGSGAQAAVLDETIRVSTAKLDALMLETQALLVARSRSEHLIGVLTTLAREIVARPHDTPPGTAGAGGLERELYALSRKIARDNAGISKAVQGLDNTARRLRMLPLEAITHSLTRLVRDAGRDLGKRVRLELQGTEVELDKVLLEAIKDPLLHLLRNAVDHGIEDPDARRAVGKDPEGRILLAVEQRGTQVMIQVRDDGRGIDTDAVRAQAQRRGLPFDASASDEATAALLFTPGFSTRSEAGPLSGRGVGMDVVKVNVERMGGRVAIAGISGQGTMVTVIVPVTVATVDCLLVEVAARTVAIPLLSVERAIRVPPDDVRMVGGQPTVPYAGQRLPLRTLRGLLELPPAPSASWITAVVLTGSYGGLALAVDAIRGRQEVVQKPLGFPLGQVGIIAGAAILGDGKLAVIAHPGRLLLAAQSRADLSSTPAGPTAPARVRHILVVDDSITTRTLERSILQSMGFAVSVARDGQDALGVLEAEPIDLVVSDVEMSPMDGFSLTKRIRGDPRYATLPVVLVTSLDAPEQRAHGLAAGADAYIVKRGFDQQHLVEVINRLLGAD